MVGARVDEPPLGGQGFRFVEAMEMDLVCQSQPEIDLLLGGRARTHPEALDQPDPYPGRVDWQAGHLTEGFALGAGRFVVVKPSAPASRHRPQIASLG
jgi:hypothetical protein